MMTALLIFLVILDLVLLAAVVFLNRRQEAHVELVQEVTEERRMLTELRASVQEELEDARRYSKDMLARITKMATEVEQEISHSRSSVSADLDEVFESFSSKFNEPLERISAEKNLIESQLLKVEKQKESLLRVVNRAEKICKFFDERVPYEAVLEEIEDKKYVDARRLIARGEAPAQVAKELGLSETEVRLVAGLAARSL